MEEDRSLRLIVIREIRTFYSVSEMLECGHRFESLTLLADPLIAKRRVCPKCAERCTLPAKKPAPEQASSPMKRVA